MPKDQTSPDARAKAQPKRSVRKPPKPSPPKAKAKVKAEPEKSRKKK